MNQDFALNLTELVQFVILKVSLLYLFDNRRLAENMHLSQRGIPLDSDRQAYEDLLLTKVQVD